MESDRIVADAQALFEVTDSKGRVLEVKRLTRREVMRHMRQWGTASNVTDWLANALISAAVRSIDGKPIPVATTPDQIEAISEMLGQEGAEAVAKWFQEDGEPDLATARADAKN